MNRVFLSSADVLQIHSVLLQKYGGADGIRDMGAVEAAVFRPQCGYYRDLIEEACALLESLLFNHAFVDGNKRTAFAACDVFLRINGMHILAANDEIFQTMIAWINAPQASRWQMMISYLRSKTLASV